MRGLETAGDILERRFVGDLTVSGCCVACGGCLLTPSHDTRKRPARSAVSQGAVDQRVVGFDRRRHSLLGIPIAMVFCGERLEERAHLALVEPGRGRSRFWSTGLSDKQLINYPVTLPKYPGLMFASGSSVGPRL